MRCKPDTKAAFIAIGLSMVGAFAAVSVSGQQATTAENPQATVLSIGGSVTEIVAALGQEYRLKARDTTSTYPPSVEILPDVGYMRALSPEGILSVGPSLILSEEGAGPPEALDVIRATDVTFVEVPDAMTTDGILQKISIVGDALDVPDRANQLAAKVAAEMQGAMTDAQRPEDEKKRVLFVLSTQGGRINASGTGTAADAIIRMAGGRNAVSDFEGYKQITDEALGNAAPDVILMMNRTGEHAITDDALLDMPALRLTPAAETRSVIRMDGLLMLGFGPRTAQAIRRLNDTLYDQDR